MPSYQRYRTLREVYPDFDDFPIELHNGKIIDDGIHYLGVICDYCIRLMRIKPSVLMAMLIEYQFDKKMLNYDDMFTKTYPVEIAQDMLKKYSCYDSSIDCFAYDKTYYSQILAEPCIDYWCGLVLGNWLIDSALDEHSLLEFFTWMDYSEIYGRYVTLHTVTPTWFVEAADKLIASRKNNGNTGLIYARKSVIVGEWQPPRDIIAMLPKSKGKIIGAFDPWYDPADENGPEAYPKLPEGTYVDINEIGDNYHKLA